MSRRYSVPYWNKTALQVASMSCGQCRDVVGLVGIDMHAQDGDVFAHGHFELEQAKAFYKSLGEVIAEVEACNADGVQPLQ